MGQVWNSKAAAETGVDADHWIAVNENRITDTRVMERQDGRLDLQWQHNITTDDKIDYFSVRWRYWDTTNNRWILGAEDHVNPASKVDGWYVDTITKPDMPRYLQIEFYVQPIAKNHSVTRAYMENGQQKTVTVTLPYFKVGTGGPGKYFEDYTSVMPSTPPTPSAELRPDGTALVEWNEVEDSVVTHLSLVTEVYGSGSSETARAANPQLTSWSMPAWPGGTRARYALRAWNLQNSGNTSLVAQSEWSEWADWQPADCSGLSVRCTSATAAQVTFSCQGDSGDSYEIYYSDVRSDLDDPDASSTVRHVSTPAGSYRKGTYSYSVGDLADGKPWWFRARAVNAQGKGGWSNVASCTVGAAPQAPTLMDTAPAYPVGPGVAVGWVHNATDGSEQTGAQVAVAVNQGTATVHDVAGAADNYTIATGSLSDGDAVTWSVRTKGATGEYGPWAAATFSVYTAPTCAVSAAMTDLPPLTLAVTMPGWSAAAAQQPARFEIWVTSDSAYIATRRDGSTYPVAAGEAVWSATSFAGDPEVSQGSGASTATHEVGAVDFPFVSGQDYTVHGIVATNMGLVSAEATCAFACRMSASDLSAPIAFATIGEGRSAVVYPVCLDDEGDVRDDVELSVYRILPGELVPIVEGLTVSGVFDGGPDAGESTAAGYPLAVTDPHPTFGEATYRVAALDPSTGAVATHDVSCPMPFDDIYIQWRGQPVGVGKSGDVTFAERSVSLPENVKIDEGHAKDKGLVEAIGRKAPLAYYGSQLGETGGWSCVVPYATGSEEMSLLRELAKEMAPVYVREPSGVGYWAHVDVGFKYGYDTALVDVSISVTRVDRREP